MAAKHKDLEEVKHYLNAVNEDKKTQITARRSISKALINHSNSEYNKMVANNQVQGNPIPVRVSKTVMKITTINLQQHLMYFFLGERGFLPGDILLNIHIFFNS